MNISVTARHFEASQNLKELSQESIEKLNQFYDRIVSCDVIFEPTSNPKKPQKVELILKVPQKVLTVNEAAETYEKALGSAVDVLARQLKKYKQKLNMVH